MLMKLEIEVDKEAITASDYAIIIRKIPKDWT